MMISKQDLLEAEDRDERRWPYFACINWVGHAVHRIAVKPGLLFEEREYRYKSLTPEEYQERIDIENRPR